MRGRYGQPLDVNFGPYVGMSDAWSHFEPRYSLDVDSIAAFAQGELALGDKLSATLGARFTHDNKRFDYAWSATTAWAPVLFYKDSANFDNVALKAQLDWRPAPGVLVYGGYTRGHKGGNWAAPAFPPINTAVMPHKQEVLNSLEAGAKLKLPGNFATLNVSAYHYIYNNYQAFSLQGVTQAIFNKDALVTGAEAELRMTPMRGLDLSGSVALIDSKVKAVGLPDGTTADRQLPNAPGFQATGLARYAWGLAGGQMAAQVSGKYMGAHYSPCSTNR
jgi:iron complex outermembrane receptor protein